MRRAGLVLLAVCATATCLRQDSHDGEQGAHIGRGRTATSRAVRAAAQEHTRSEKLGFISQNGWTPLGPGPNLLPWTPSYASPPSHGDFRLADASIALDGPATGSLSAVKDPVRTRRPTPNDNETAMVAPVSRSTRHQQAALTAPTGRLGPGPSPLPLPIPLPPEPWPRATPVSEPSNDVEASIGYRYPAPLLAAGPSPTLPFWEVAYLRRRERILHELGLPGLLPGLPPSQKSCCCACGACGYPGAGPGLPGLFAPGLDGLDPGLPFGLLGRSRALHSHNTAPLGAARLHDNPN